MMEKPYTLVQRGKEGLPMGPRAARYKRDDGTYNSWRCVTFRFEEAVRFKTKEEALFKLDEIYLKYGNSAKRWKVQKFEKVKVPKWLKEHHKKYYTGYPPVGEKK